MRKIRHGLEVSLDMPLTEADPSTSSHDVLRPPRVLGGNAAAAVVEEWRQPRTLTTLSWIDGAVGRGWVSFREGTISQEVQERLSAELRKWLVFDRPQAKTHVWNEDTYVRYLTFLEQDGDLTCSWVLCRIFL